MGHDREKEAAFFFGNCHTKFKNLCYTMPMLRVEGLDKSGFVGEKLGLYQ